MSLGDPLRKLAADASRFHTEWPREAAQMVGKAVDAQLRADTGGDGGFSNIPRVGKGTVEIESSAPGYAEVSAAGSWAVWTWLERGTSGHEIAARSSKRKAALRTPYGPRRRVTVRGMTAKRTWSRPVDKAVPQVLRDLDRRLDKLGG